jgi:hypothetical protein
MIGHCKLTDLNLMPVFAIVHQLDRQVRVRGQDRFIINEQGDDPLKHDNVWIEVEQLGELTGYRLHVLGALPVRVDRKLVVRLRCLGFERRGTDNP